MSARLILTVLSVVFLVLAALRLGRGRGRVDPAARTWLIIAVLFGAVSVWLWSTEPSQ
jgi:hypothetical protein